MTNGEKIKEIFPDTKIITQYDNPFGDRFMVFTLNNEHMQVNLDWWNTEYKEPTTKNDLGVDCISRKAAEDITWQDPSYTDPLNILTEVRDKIRELPSVTPQEPRKGHWEHGRELSRVFMGDVLKGINYEDWHCSNCHCVVEQSIKPEWNYCPNCGADMREDKE